MIRSVAIWALILLSYSLAAAQTATADYKPSAEVEAGHQIPRFDAVSTGNRMGDYFVSLGVTAGGDKWAKRSNLIIFLIATPYIFCSINEEPS